MGINPWGSSTMKILIPDHTPPKDIEKLKAMSYDVELVILRVVVKENITRKILRNIASRVLSYGLYERIERVCGPQRKYFFYADGKLLVSPLEDIDVFLVSWVVDKDAFKQVIPYLPNLKWIHSIKTGIDYLDPDFTEKNKITVTNSRGVHSERIAEFALACLFSISKRIYRHIDLKRRKKWGEIESVDLKGKTVGILGAGSIGNAVAAKCSALGVKVIGRDLKSSANDNFLEIMALDRLREVIERSDFFIVCLPLTPETEGLISFKELSFMKRSAFIINLGRSTVINEKALIKALEEKAIGGAIFDVFHNKMQLPNHPFYKFDNVILTHYSAHASESSQRELFELFIMNMERYLKGQELLNVVS